MITKYICTYKTKPCIKILCFYWSIPGVFKSKFHDYLAARVNLQWLWCLRDRYPKIVIFTLYCGVFAFLDLHFLPSRVPSISDTSAGADPRGEGGTRRPPPLKLEKIWFFGVKSWFFTRNTPKMFALPSTRRNFFKCAPPPLTWNPGSAPEVTLILMMFLNYINVNYVLIYI